MSEIMYKYPDSKQNAEGAELCVAISDGVKSLVAKGGGKVHDKLEGKEAGGVKICPLNHLNAEVIREFFPFTRPSNHNGHAATIGLGDRLGLASPGHIRLIRDKDIFPVLAQQSMRELKLTGRTYGDVLDAATWAVFQENYQKGWGADGDHLKTPEEIKTALDCGFTMITLDCSEHIGKDPEALASGEGYKEAIEYTAGIFNNVILKCGRDIDFELSIDETECTTTPEAHLFVAEELRKRGVSVTSMAPRFCGQFQKGIDYIGDINQFEREFAAHADIARKYGYKISVHSGSDKLSVYPIIGRETRGVFHVKTAGTNMLEAQRVIAVKEPELFRRMFEFALANLPEAKKYYHITTNTSNIPDIDKLGDDELPSLLDFTQPDARQTLHVTFGLVLLAKEDGKAVFKDDLYAALASFEDDYYAALIKHIGRHLELLGI